jgi:hypothetical protein
MSTVIFLKKFYIFITPPPPPSFKRAHQNLHLGMQLYGFDPMEPSPVPRINDYGRFIIG